MSKNNSLVVDELGCGHKIGEHTGLCPRFDRGEEARTSSLFLRDLSVCVDHDFDRMVDKIRFVSRSAPWTAMKRSGFTFDKRHVMLDLPPIGTAERQGADMIISALALFLRDHEG